MLLRRRGPVFLFAAGWDRDENSAGCAGRPGRSRRAEWKPDVATGGTWRWQSCRTSRASHASFAPTVAFHFSAFERFGSRFALRQPAAQIGPRESRKSDGWHHHNRRRHLLIGAPPTGQRGAERDAQRVTPPGKSIPPPPFPFPQIYFRIRFAFSSP